LGDVLHLITAPAVYGIAVWILAIVFVRSGVAKLRRPGLAAMAMQDFGVLRQIRPRLGSALGAAELLLALAPLPYAGLGQRYLPQALSAAAFVGAIALGGQIPKLLRWNRDPYRLGNTEANQ